VTLHRPVRLDQVGQPHCRTVQVGPGPAGEAKPDHPDAR